MNQHELRDVVINAIQEIAPEIEEAEINSDEDLREECDLDSMDFLNVLVEIKQKTGVNVPEQDYPQVMTLNTMLNYLQSKV